MRLTVDAAVGAAWAVSGRRGAAIVLGDPPPDLAERLGVGDVDVVVLRPPGDGGRDLAPGEAVSLLRQWVHQAASGAGRGVALSVAGLPGGPFVLTVTSWDSSARELCQRLASPQEPALAALRSLLGTQVTVVDGEDA